MIDQKTQEKIPNLVFSTSNTSIHQCDITEKFVINLFEGQIALNLCGLIAFKKRINEIDLAGMFDNNHSGIEIISLRHTDRLFVFDIREILELRDLFSGSFVMLELNSVIHKTLVRNRAYLERL
ncbi:MAG: hypothetical protein JXR03_03955 [Cyclobacteriaceae bacterium]